MNRSKFERFARKNGLPLERLSNDKRYASLETEWAWRGYCEATESLVSEAVAICQEEADEWDSDRLVTHKNYAEHCGKRIRRLSRRLKESTERLREVTRKIKEDTRE